MRVKRGVQRERESLVGTPRKTCDCWLYSALASLLEANSMCLSVARRTRDPCGAERRLVFSSCVVNVLGV